MQNRVQFAFIYFKCIYQHKRKLNMEPDFWHNRWENNLTGFHLDEVNPQLQANWSAMSLPAGSRVFVPLCGKTLDLVWLAQQGYQVVGVELSPLAVQAFFTENNITPQRSQLGKLEYWQSENISLLCGDFFHLTPDILGRVDAVYDRASLIALPPQMRQRYVTKMAEICPSVPKFLITLDYDQSKMDGPPFSVTENEVRELYQGSFEISQLVAQDVLGDNERFKERLDYMNECVFQLLPRA
jgi:thiopurine S-methyltransferase